MSKPTNLVTVRPGLTLQAPAALSWTRMESARGKPLDVNRSYASYEVQLKLYNQYRAYITYVNGGPFAPWAPLALHPDHSWHCRGLAVDTDDDGWIRMNPQFGWRFVVPSEKWHAQYYPEHDKSYGGLPAGGGSVPFPTPTPDPAPSPNPPTIKEDDDMLLITAPDCQPAIAGPGYWRPISSANGSEYLSVAATLAARRVDYKTKREYQVARALCLEGQVPK